MKGNKKLLAKLNDLLSDELTAINQYMVHAEMAANWGFPKLEKMIEGRAVVEMKHAEKLIGRILFLEGIPVVSSLKKITIGADVPAQFANDLVLEMGAIKSYNDGVKLAGDVGDNTTKTFLESILNDEDSHVDQIEEQQDRISQMGLQVYLSTQA
jgi:bacterioferritin